MGHQARPVDLQHLSLLADALDKRLKLLFRGDEVLSLQSIGDGVQVEPKFVQPGQKRFSAGRVCAQGIGDRAMIQESVERGRREGRYGAGTDEGIDVMGIRIVEIARRGPGPFRPQRPCPLPRQFLPARSPPRYAQAQTGRLVNLPPHLVLI